jgi:hypothetical protein
MCYRVVCEQQHVGQTSIPVLGLVVPAQSVEVAHYRHLLSRLQQRLNDLVNTTQNASMGVKQNEPKTRIHDLERSSLTQYIRSICDI